MATAQATYIATDTATFEKAIKPQIPLLARPQSKICDTHRRPDRRDLPYLIQDHLFRWIVIERVLLWGSSDIHGASQPAIGILRFEIHSPPPPPRNLLSTRNGGSKRKNFESPFLIPAILSLHYRKAIRTHLLRDPMMEERKTDTHTHSNIDGRPLVQIFFLGFLPDPHLYPPPLALWAPQIKVPHPIHPFPKSISPPQQRLPPVPHTNAINRQYQYNPPISAPSWDVLSISHLKTFCWFMRVRRSMCMFIYWLNYSRK